MLRQAINRSLPLLVTVLLFVPTTVSAKVVEQLIAVIDGEPYTLTSFGAYAKTKLGREFPTGDLNQINDTDREVLEQFITDKLLESEVREAGIKVTDEDIDQYIAQIKQRNRLTDEDLATALGREGHTMAAYRLVVKAELEKNEIVNRQVRQKVNITNDDVERYYKLNGKSFRSEERAHIRHILLSLPEKATPEQVQAALAKAAELRKRILAGEDFATLAREFSEGAGQADGGDIGWVKRGTLINELEQVAFKMAVGQISEPFRTSMGVHVVKLEERDAGTVPPLSSVAAKIKEELYAKALEDKFTNWVKSDLRRKHRIDVKLPGVTFKAEDSKEGMVDSLMAQSPRLNKRSRSWWSFLNPFKEKDDDGDSEDPNSPLYGKKVVTVFGVPVGTTDAIDDVPDILSTPPEKKAGSTPAQTEKSGGFLSSVVDSLNPFSSSKR